MDILIKGLALPKKGEVMKLYLCSDGDVGYDEDGKPYKTTAIELPPHGRLIDVNKTYKRATDAFIDINDQIELWKYDGKLIHDIYKTFLETLESAPAVLEANYGSDN